MRFHNILLIVFVLVTAGRAQASISYASVGATYTQDFNSLASIDTGNTAWANDTTIEGWHLFRIAGMNNGIVDHTIIPITSYEVSNGSVTANRFFSFGDNPTNSDRALGSIGGGFFGDVDGNVGNIAFGHTLGWIAASITNNTGIQLTNLSLRYDGEQWRDGGASPQTMVLQYGFGATFTDVSNWSTPNGSFNFTSPVNDGAGVPVNGNGAGRVADLGGAITGLSWSTGSTLWLRWVEFDDGGPDHGLAIDNVSFSATSNVAAVPEAGAFLFGTIATTLAGSAYIRWKILSARTQILV